MEPGGLLQMRKLVLMMISFGAFSGCAAAVMASGYAECFSTSSLVPVGEYLEFQSDSFTKTGLAVTAARAAVDCATIYGNWGAFDSVAGAGGDLLAGFAASYAEGADRMNFYDEEDNWLYDVYGRTFAAADLYIEHSYVLLGGHGQATLHQIGSFESGVNGPGAHSSCRLGFGLDAVDCESYNLDWVVTFGVPFTLVVDMSTVTQGGLGSGESAYIHYDLSSVVATQNGIAIPGAHLVPIPEPSPKSLFLLGLAVVGLLRLTQRMSPSGHSSVR